MAEDMQMRIGWAKPKAVLPQNTMKWHFFSRGRSLCGRHGDQIDNDLLATRPSIPLLSCCAKCLDRRSH